LIDHHHQSGLGWAFGMKMKRRRMHENLIPTAGVVSSPIDRDDGAERAAVA
jgi:hypothetical protein